MSWCSHSRSYSGGVGEKNTTWLWLFFFQLYWGKGAWGRSQGPLWDGLDVELFVSKVGEFSVWIRGEAWKGFYFEDDRVVMNNAFLLRLNTFSLFLTYYLVLFRLMITSLTQTASFCFFWGGGGITINKHVNNCFWGSVWGTFIEEWLLLDDWCDEHLPCMYKVGKQ